MMSIDAKSMETIGVILTTLAGSSGFWLFISKRKANGKNGNGNGNGFCKDHIAMMTQMAKACANVENISENIGYMRQEIQAMRSEIMSLSK